MLVRSDSDWFCINLSSLFARSRRRGISDIRGPPDAVLHFRNSTFVCSPADDLSFISRYGKLSTFFPCISFSAS